MVQVGWRGYYGSPWGIEMDLLQCIRIMINHNVIIDQEAVMYRYPDEENIWREIPAEWVAKTEQKRENSHEGIE
jgi:hypothetical protein